MLDPPEHSLLIHALEELADYGSLQRRSKHWQARATGHGIQRIIREMFAEIELGHNTTKEETND